LFEKGFFFHSFVGLPKVKKENLYSTGVTVFSSKTKTLFSPELEMRKKFKFSANSLSILEIKFTPIFTKLKKII
jgi:hypothetical protein